MYIESVITIGLSAFGVILALIGIGYKLGRIDEVIKETREHTRETNADVKTLSARMNGHLEGHATGDD